MLNRKLKEANIVLENQFKEVNIKLNNLSFRKPVRVHFNNHFRQENGLGRKAFTKGKIFM